LKKLQNYEKTQKYFTKQDHDIYLKLIPLLKTALSNSSTLGAFDLDEQTKAICEMFLLFEADELKKHYKKCQKGYCLHVPVIYMVTGLTSLRPNHIIVKY
jgi:hypothetical protein